MATNKSNRVVVYVWFCKADGGEDVGHVSLKTSNLYISLWPGKDTDKRHQASMFFEHRDQVSFHTYEKDINAEGRPPEFTCCLYSLSVVDIEKRARELLPQIGNWSILGNTKFNRPNDSATGSCSSLIRDLLNAGKIDRLSSEGVTVRFMPSPHNVFTRVRNAKEKELVLYPETASYDQEDGYKVDLHSEVATSALKQTASDKCLVM